MLIQRTRRVYRAAPRAAGSEPPLQSPIRRVFYLTKEGSDPEHEVSLPANSALLQELAGADAIIYGVGSLYTSLAPSLVLRGVGEAVAAREGVPKVLMLNGGHDRETSACLRGAGPMAAVRRSCWCCHHARRGDIVTDKPFSVHTLQRTHSMFIGV